MNVFELNPWGFTSLLTAVVSVLFVYFLWRIVSPSPLIKRFTVLPVDYKLIGGSLIPILY